MAKIHLTIATEPVPSGQDITATCGEKIPHAEAVPLADLEIQGTTIQFCKSCFGRKYFYAISAAQDAHDLRTGDL